jgi:hypothetical protein
MIEEHGATKAKFGIAFGSNQANMIAEKSLSMTTERWNQFEASFATNDCGPPSVSLILQGNISTAESSAIHDMSAWGTLPTMPIHSLTSTSTMTCREVKPSFASGILANTNDPPSRIENLCGELWKEKKNLKGT